MHASFYSRAAVSTGNGSSKKRFNRIRNADMLISDDEAGRGVEATPTTPWEIDLRPSM
jgi:hypothetical protein